MNNTTINNDELLEELNDQKAATMVPAFVYLGALMLIGISGNLLVCYYYGCKTRQSSNNIFFLGVAMYDLVLCTVSIPIELVDIRYFYNFPYVGVCKVMRFVTYFAAIGSVFTLIIIAVDRYRKICRPFKMQFGPKQAKIACAMSIPFSLLFSWPAAVFYTSVPVDVQTEDGIELKGYDCTTTKEASYKLYLWIFNGFFLLCFIISACILFGMYGFIGKAIYKHHKTHINLTRPKSTHHKATDRHVTEHKQTHSRTDGHYTNSSTGSDVHSENVSNEPKGHISLKTVKFTTVMFVITTVFVVSFLPHLALSLWRAFQGSYEGESLTGASLVAFQIGLRSYFLNSAINPLTNGFFYSKFRSFFYRTFCPLCNRFTESHTVSSSSGTTMQYQMHPMNPKWKF